MKKINNLMLFLLSTAPGRVLAAPLITDPTAGPKTSPKDVTAFVNNVKNIALVIVGVIIFAMLIYGGVLYITSSGNDEKLQKAKQTITAALVGLIIVVCAAVIVSVVINTLMQGG